LYKTCSDKFMCYQQLLVHRCWGWQAAKNLLGAENNLFIKPHYLRILDYRQKSWHLWMNLRFCYWPHWDKHFNVSALYWLISTFYV